MSLRTFALLPMLAVCAGCYGGQSATGGSSAASLGRSASTVKFSTEGLSFRYPAAWRKYSWSFTTSFSNSIVYLSTGREHDPCTTTSGDGTTVTRCGQPLHQVEPSGVLVTWTAWARPELPTTAFPGKNIMIGGRHAKLQTQSGCPGLGGDESIRVVIPMDRSGRWTEMDACLRGPDLAASRGQIDQLLASVRFT